MMMQRWAHILRGSLQMMIWNVSDYNMGQMNKKGTASHKMRIKRQHSHLKLIFFKCFIKAESLRHFCSRGCLPSVKYAILSKPRSGDILKWYIIMPLLRSF